MQSAHVYVYGNLERIIEKSTWNKIFVSENKFLESKNLDYDIQLIYRN